MFFFVFGSDAGDVFHSKLIHNECGRFIAGNRTFVSVFGSDAGGVSHGIDLFVL